MDLQHWFHGTGAFQQDCSDGLPFGGIQISKGFQTLFDQPGYLDRPDNVRKNKETINRVRIIRSQSDERFQNTIN
jgi:hypothetical protein